MYIMWTLITARNGGGTGRSRYAMSTRSLFLFVHSNLFSLSLSLSLSSYFSSPSFSAPHLHLLLEVRHLRSRAVRSHSNRQTSQSHRFTATEHRSWVSITSYWHNNMMSFSLPSADAATFT